MLKIIKNFNWIVLSSFLSIFLGIITFLTFINQGFVTLSSKNLQFLLVIDILLLVVFFSLIFNNVWKIYQAEKKNKLGSKTNLKYISLFSLFTFIPSLLIALFSLFLFSFGVEKFFNDRITNAVNNSYNVSKSYLEESKKTVKTDIILMNVGIDRASNYFYSDLNRFINIIRSEKILRRVNDVYLIDSVGSIIISELDDPNLSFISPTEDNFNDAVDGYPVLVTNNLENKTSFLMKLNNLIDTYLYISRNIDPEILDYLNETEQAVDFYYTVKNSQTGIKISFAIIYIIVVTLLLFLSTVVAISFATGLTKPIINLITASEKISKGELNTKVDSSSEDIEFKILNNNFNNMIERLKKQQDKLLLSERYSAWESVARKLAHEIKNPLTPIQLSIDRLREKYASKISDGHDEFVSYLQTINRQIKDIERLVNEFSNFARMPAPVFKKVNIYGIIKRAKDFLKISIKSTLNFKNEDMKMLIKGDEEQLYRVFINLIKNADESINEKRQKNPQFKGKIDIDIQLNNDYILIQLIDNGNGIIDTKKIMTPYFTTKKTGTGLGLPIVSKIINEHNGDLLITNNRNNEGVTILISLPLNNEK
jgi:two-component system, NtrC family, nitrogen regulation sensor histidine kinase NtrY